ncbi:unnamed protein product [Adineta ricciae]|uniref:Aminopeptidase n=1 Tax=Adineta ricciae TaxID=249248 RepID=A0A815F503_ADIRI|nr:unnamed protein product [Adineta ricciae]CAF1491458.1 unnamed protein product [Adineta ricciae]
MAKSDSPTNNELDGSRNRRISSLRQLPKSWIIIAIVFYCASLVTVGLLAGLLPRRIQYITVLETSSLPTTVTQNPSECVEDECNSRLLSDLIVDSYELEYICNDIKQTTMEGQVTINFQLRQPIKQLIYHAKEMIELKDAILFENGVQHAISMKRYLPNDYLSLRLVNNSLFPNSQYKLKQKFVINLLNPSIGFYQSLFQDTNQINGTLLATKFRATEARRVFPCFDEPRFKAQYKITLIHPQNTISLSNFPILKQSVENNSLHTTFAETFRMSTYVVSWAILPETYGKISDNDQSPTVTIWARQEPTKKNHTTLALDIATNAIPFYKNYFNIAEALPPKKDILAIANMATTAMESSGLITYREERIIYDEKIATTYQKQQFADIVAHEIAHSWFGNYVSCKWWNDLWFSEVMVSWLCRKTFANKYSDWNMELQILTDDTISAMWDDAKPYSHPIAVGDTMTIPEILSYLDGLTYSKGISLMRMVEKIVGGERFQRSLQEYLRTNAFKVADLNQFYSMVLGNSTNGREFMKSWLDEMNYPLVTIDLQAENNSTKLIFTQSRFIISDTFNTTNLNQNYRWKIYLDCTLGRNNSNSERIRFFLENEQSIEFLPENEYSWVKCNRDFQSFHITKYPSNSIQSFSSIIKAQPTFFSIEDQINLLQDTFLLAYKGLGDYLHPLTIVDSIGKTSMTEYVQWRTFQYHWDILADLIDHRPDILTKFQNFAIQQILSNGRTVENITSLSLQDNHNSKLVKSLQFALLCRMNYSDALDKASLFFRSIPKDYFNNTNDNINVPADFLSTVYTYHLTTDDDENDWNQMYQYYQIGRTSHEQTRALMAISFTKNTNRLNRLLSEGLTGGPYAVKRQDYFTMMGYMSRHVIGRDIVWNFYKNNYSNLVDTFTLQNFRFGSVILSITRTFEKETYLDEMNDLFAKYPNAGVGQSARQQAIDQVKMNIHWINTREQNLRTALDSIAQS